MTLGTQNFDSTLTFKGNLYDFRYYNRALSQDEITNICYRAEVLEDEVLRFRFGENSCLKDYIDYLKNNNIQSNIVSLLKGHFTTESFERTSSQQWDDESGLNDHKTVTRGTIRKDYDEYGVPFIYGGVDDGIRLTTFDNFFTIFVNGRYTPDNYKYQIEQQSGEVYTVNETKTKLRITQGTQNNFSHGWMTSSIWGVGYYGKYVTPAGSYAGGAGAEDWLVIGGRNTGLKYFTVNGVDIASDSGGNDGGILNINDGQYSYTNSDWQVREVVLWGNSSTTTLTDDEFTLVSNLMTVNQCQKESWTPLQMQTIPRSREIKQSISAAIF